MTQRQEQKRGASRFAAGLPATLHVHGREYDCRAEDLSRAGTLLVGDLPDQAGPKVEVTVATPAGDLSVRVGAVVRRVLPAGEENPVRIGVEFGEIPADTDLDLAADLIVGPITVHVFFRPGKVPARLVQPLLEMALSGIRGGAARR